MCPFPRAKSKQQWSVDREPRENLLPTSYALFVLLAFLLATASSVPADVVTMKDGRTFEGNITADASGSVTIDTVVATMRTTLMFNRADIADVERKPLPASFFETKTNPPAEKSTKTYDSGAQIYMEIPIVGRIGDQVVPAGISQCLNYAAGNGIKHIVFLVDSQGGDVDATAQISRFLQAYDNRLVYHSIIRDAVGMALVFPLWSTTNHLKPGATLGGAAIIFDPKKLQPGMTEAIMKTQIAKKAADIAKKHNLPYTLVPAMIDPTAALTVWREPSGAIAGGFQPPKGIPQSAVIFSNVKNPQLLTLTRDLAVAAGFGTAFDGDSNDLGAALKISSWTSEGSYGFDAIKRTSEQAFQSREQAAAKFEKDVQTVTARREEVAQYIQSNTTDAANWDPSKSVPAISGVYGDNNSKVISSGGQSNWFTDQADMTLGALKRAIKGIDEMKGLEAQAAKLGLPPMYKPGQLDDQRTTLQNQANFVQRERDRQSNVVSY